MTETQEQYDIGTATYYSGDVEMPRLRHIQSDSLRIQDSKPLSLGFDTFLQKWPHVLDRLVRDGVVPQAERYTVSIQPPSRVSIHGVLQIFCFERQEGAESWQVLDMMMRHKGLNRNGAQEKIKIEPGYSGPCERFEEYHAS